MGIRSSTKPADSDGSPLPAFSEHILKIEKLGPEVRPFLHHAIIYFKNDPLT